MKKNLRIVFQYYYGTGGALSNMMLLLKTISRQYPEDHIDIVCSAISGLRSLEMLPNVEILTYSKGPHREIDRALLGYGGLRDIAKERNADVIWSLNLGSYVKTDVPQVLSVNNSHQVYPWEVTRYHPDNPLNVAALRWFFRKSLAVADGVIVQTPIMGEYIRQISKTPKKIAVVPKAVENAADVAPEPLSDEIRHLLQRGDKTPVFTFLFVATYTPHKNHKVLIDAFSILARDGIPVRVVLTVNPDELVACGGKLASNLIKSGYLVPVGWTKKQHLKSLYDSCDACLMPSLLESLSSAHLEAMQWGKSQITSDLPYSRDLCGDAAVYVPVHDSAAWAGVIRDFIHNPELRAKLVKNGHARMQSFPGTWSEVACRVHDFLEQIIVQH